MIALPLFLQMTLEYNAMQAGLSLAPLSLTMFAAALVAGKRAGDRRPAAIIRAGFLLASRRDRDHHPARAAGGQRLVPRGPAGHRRLRPGPAGVAAEQLHPRPDRGGAGQRGRRGELRRRVVRPVLRSGHGRRPHARRAVVQLHPPDREQHGHPAGPAAADRRRPRGRRRGHEQHRSSAEQITGQPPEVEAAVLAINDDARNRSLQVALLVPLLASLLGLGNSFRMLRLPDVEPAADLDGLDFG